MTQTIVFTGMGVGLLGMKKWRASAEKKVEDTLNS
jgi:hypothetical protein